MKAVTRAFTVLEQFLDREGELSLSDLSRLSGLNKTTVSRITSTLVKLGYLRQHGKRGKYSLGVKFLDFSGSLKSNIKIRDVAIPYLSKLGRLVGESVIMATWDGREAITHEIFHANHLLKVAPDEGTRIPLHSTAIGKIILADMSAEELQKYFCGRTLEQNTPNTITNLNDLKKHVLIVKQEGIAFDDEEYSVGVRGVAAGLRNNEENMIGAIGVLGPSVRLTRTRIREIVPDVKSYALAISKELGYRGE